MTDEREAWRICPSLILYPSSFILHLNSCVPGSKMRDAAAVLHLVERRSRSANFSSNSRASAASTSLRTSASCLLPGCTASQRIRRTPKGVRTGGLTSPTFRANAAREKASSIAPCRDSSPRRPPCFALGPVEYFAAASAKEISPRGSPAEVFGLLSPARPGVDRPAAASGRSRIWLTKTRLPSNSRRWA